MSELRIYRMNDEVWWIGRSAEECIKDYVEFFGLEDEVDDSEVFALSDKQLDSLTYVDESARPSCKTFRQQLAVEIRRGGEFPRLFATTSH